jgi:POT family proton-dependent oligopeptide transporter
MGSANEDDKAYKPPAEPKEKGDALDAALKARAAGEGDAEEERPVPITAFERRFKHPPGLFILFFTEMWERFSYYGMRGLLKLYMVNYLFITIRQSLQGKAFDGSGSPDLVLGWHGVQKAVSFFLGLFHMLPTDAQGKECIAETIKQLTSSEGHQPVAQALAEQIAPQQCAVGQHASILYGAYTALVYLTPLLGGYIADKYFGQRKTVVVGGILMAIGHFIMAFQNWFFVALLFLIIGNGAFKPNISTQVGNLYGKNDGRRDGAFTIFYMGINLGAFICNLVCGTLALVYGWHYGFGAAGVGMCLGLIIYLAGQRFLAPDNVMKAKAAHASGTPEAAKPKDVDEKHPLSPEEWKRVGALIALCALNVVFWAVYEQQGNTMQSWADTKTIWPTIFGWQIPSTWFQSFNPFFIFMIAPVLDMFWSWQKKKQTEPTSVTKMAIGCFLLGGSFIFMIVGNRLIGDAGKGSLFWPVACTLILTLGELYLSPIGLSLVTKVSPVRIVSLMMGMWFLSSFFGNFLSGVIGALYEGHTLNAQQFFILLTALGVATGLAIFAFNRPLRKIIGNH